MNQTNLFLFLLCAASLLVSVPGHAQNLRGNQEPRQQSTVSGIVTDIRNEPLPGVTVVVKGASSIGAATKDDGTFSLVLQGTINEPVLVFSFIGMKTKEVPYKGEYLNVTMEDDISLIDEVVVVGYGTQKKVNLTGAISSMSFDNKETASRAVANISNALSGKISGIRTVQSSGFPSNGSAIQVRGVGSLNASQTPLVIIDGVVGDLNSISPNDVASVSVLKDAASSAIYGARASNGVILVTTKSGSNNKVSLNYTGYVGVGKAKKTHDLISYTPDYMKVMNRMQLNSGFQQPYSDEFISEWATKSKTDPIGYPNTDWWDVLMKDNIKTNHHISARGGNDIVNFYSSVSYYSDNGLIPSTSFNRINLRNNLNYKINDKLKIGGIFSISNTTGNITDAEKIFGWWRASSPSTLPKHADGRYGGSHLANEAGANNMLRNIETRYANDNTDTNNYSAKIIATFTPIKNLEVIGSYFFDITNSERLEMSPNMSQYPLWNFKDENIVSMWSFVSNITNHFNKNQRHVYDLFANYDLNLANHNVKILAGYNQEYYKSNWFNARKEDLLSIDTPVLNAASSNPTASGNAGDYAMRSLFGRINYDYMGKYLFEANLRYDGSSRFPTKSRWGMFPSMSLAWRITEEDFWRANGNVENLKFRFSWGQLGNSGIGNYEWQSTYSPTNYSFNEIAIMGLKTNMIPNTNLTWETTNVLNIGVDLNVFKKFYVDVNYYDKLTKNILTLIPVPLTTGGLTPPRVNSAQVRNSGIETEANYRDNFGDLSLSVSANFSYNKNKIVKYRDDFIEPHGIGAWSENYPIGVYWIREIDHIVQDQSEIDQLVQNGWTFHPSVPGPGDFLYKDNNGDKRIDNNDRVLKGNPIPLYNFGGDLTLAYKGFDIYILGSGVAGWDKYLKGDLFSTNRNILGYLVPESYFNSWTTENKSTTIPKLYTNSEKNNVDSDFFLHDASFFKIRSIQLGYTFQFKNGNPLMVNKIRVYGNLENYFTFTSFPGQDPENNDISYPLSKTASLGISIDF